ncbi:MAG: hypothetical protein WC716_12715 [Chitinophagaceae bacterium]|jgi:hypothetical protein
MKKQNPLILSIPNPCDENWAEMTSAEKGKFCSHCQKTVIDISGLDDKALLQFLSGQKESICLRALTSQTNRPLAEPVSRPNKFAYAAATLGFSLMLLAGGNAFARAPYHPKTYTAAEDKREPFMQTPDSVLLQGQVIDTAQKPVSNVVLKIFSDSVLHSTVISDTDGCFQVWVSKKVITEQKLLLETNHLSYQKERLWLTKELTETVNSILLTVQPVNYQIQTINIIQTHVMGVWLDRDMVNPIKFKVLPHYKSKKFKVLKKKK